jgi:peptide chain release factor 1
MSVPSNRIAQIEARHAELSAEMARPDLSAERFVQLSKEYAELTPVAEKAGEVRKLREELAGLRSMIDDPAGDAEMREMAEAEIGEIEAKLSEAERELSVALLPKDAADEAATRRRCSPATCSACTSAMPRSAAGGSS